MVLFLSSIVYSEIVHGPVSNLATLYILGVVVQLWGLSNSILVGCR